MSGVFANTTWSSANRIRKSFSSLTVNIPSRFELMFSRMSFTKSMNNNGEPGSPCFRPMYELKNSEKVFLYLMHSLTVEYMDFIALTSLQLICSDSSFSHKCDRSILSKHFSKSINTQYNFSFELSTFDIIECRMNTQSVVDLPFWKPN